MWTSGFAVTAFVPRLLPRGVCFRHRGELAMSAGTLVFSAGIGRGYLGFGLQMSTRASSKVVAASVAGLAVVTLLRWATRLREEDGVVCSPLSELILRWRLRRLEAAPPLRGPPTQHQHECVPRLTPCPPAPQRGSLGHRRRL